MAKRRSGKSFKTRRNKKKTGMGRKKRKSQKHIKKTRKRMASKRRKKQHSGAQHGGFMGFMFRPHKFLLNGVTNVLEKMTRDIDTDSLTRKK